MASRALPRTGSRTLPRLATSALGLLVAWALVAGCDNASAPPPTRDPAMDHPMGVGLDPGELHELTAWAEAGPTQLRFEDVTAASGITAVNHSGRVGVKEFLLEAVGPGPAWLDYDGDGWMDVYLPDGDVFDHYDLVTEHDKDARRLRPLLRRHADGPDDPRDTLWRNRGDGTFEDVTAAAGIHDMRWSFGATAVDIDGDGDTDIFVANLGEDRLWRNRGDGTFEDVAPALGLAGDVGQWSTCAAAADLDGDGRLDLYVAGYADPAAEVDKRRRDPNQRLPEGTPPREIGGRACRWRGMDAYCGPVGLDAQHDRMLRQREDGTFEDVTALWGLVPPTPCFAFTVGIADFNEDGLLDIYVANDSVESFLWMQSRGEDGRIRFRDLAVVMGVKWGHNENPQASMGMSIADADRDGLLDILVTNFSHDYNNIYKAKRVPQTNSWFFRDRGLAVWGAATYLDLSWGCGWYDLDNDADLDVVIANGHVYKEVDAFPAIGAHYEQYNAFFECMDAATLGYREVGAKAQLRPAAGVDPAHLDAGPGAAVKRCSRGAGFCDWDNDGRMDVLFGNLNGPVTLLRNTSPGDGRWIKLRLAQGGGNPDGLGALVRVTSGEITQTLPVRCGTSFLGTDDPRLHVGLGGASSCRVEVRWPEPDATSVVYEGLAAGALWLLHRDGTATSGPLPQR